MTQIIQPSFARGELGPDLYGRVDVSAYAVALRVAFNVIIHAYGGASNRPGLRYLGPVAQVSHQGDPPALIEFQFNTTDTYILEFGHRYMRVIRNDAHVLVAPRIITAINPPGNPTIEVTVPGHNFGVDDDVYVEGVQGMEEINNQWFTVGAVVGDVLFLVDQLDKGSRLTAEWSAYTGGGSISEVYQVVTPFEGDETLEIKHVQSANVMTLTHPNHPPQRLSRTDHDAWTLEEITFQPGQDHPVNLGTSSGLATRYQVTAINAESDEESLPALVASQAITAATQTNPVQLTVTSHNYASGDEIEVNDVVGMFELNGRRFGINVLDPDTFELIGEDGTGHAAYISGGTASATWIDAGSGTDAVLTWDATPGAGKYSVYRDKNGIFGWIGDTQSLTFTDDNIDPDLTLTPPRARNPFSGPGKFPAVCSYYEQRKLFGRTDERQDTTWYSVVGNEDNFSQASPRQPDDAITATLNAREVNAIQNFVPLNDLLILTSGAEWRVNAGTEAAFTAETLRQKPQSEWGSAYIDPVVVGDKVLFWTANRTYLRSIGYEITVDGYRGADMTVFSPHIFEFSPALDAAFTRWPDPIISVVKEDGTAAALTFEPEQEVVAWARWETRGSFLRVAATRPFADSIDQAAYFVTQRHVRGKQARYIERIASRRFKDVRDCFFVDAGLSLDVPISVSHVSNTDHVRVTAPGHGLSDGQEVDMSDIRWVPTRDEFFNEIQADQVNNRRFLVADSDANAFDLIRIDGRRDITNITQANPAVVTSVDHGFTEGQIIGIFDVLGMIELNGKTYVAGNVTDDTYELIGVNSTGFTAYQAGGVAHPAESYEEPARYMTGGNARAVVTELSNLWHLEGQELVGLLDGNVVENLTVKLGKLVQSESTTLVKGVSRAHVGLRYISDVGSLTPEIAAGGQSIQGRPYRTPTLTVRMKRTRGLLTGPDEFNLTEMKQRQDEPYDAPILPLTGDRKLDLFPDWEAKGRVYIRQIYPLPMTITAIVPDLDIGDDERED